MKISAYFKAQGKHVTLATSWEDIDFSCPIYVSKVFTNTYVPPEILQMPNVSYGGSGFFFDKADPLPIEIEHSMPDYHLYDEWVKEQLSNGVAPKDLKYYTDYSIGFLTRGCFRQCSFCINQNCMKCVEHSPLSEFLEPTRPKICFLDDNFFACPQWKQIIETVKASKKRFQFKQGLDIRLLTKRHLENIMTWKSYDGDFIFALDDVEDIQKVEEKLFLVDKMSPKLLPRMKFYVLCGYDKNNIYDDIFWKRNIVGVFARLTLIKGYNCLPYVMRYERCYGSRFEGVYNQIAAWCNQPNFFRKYDFATFCRCRGMNPKKYKTYKTNWQQYLADGNKKGKAWRDFEFMEEIMNAGND